MPFDIKQFFRFLASGYVCLVYYFAFLLGFSNLSAKLNFSSLTVLSSLAIGGVALSVPLGFLIHEFDISVLGRIQSTRFKRKRNSMSIIENLVNGRETIDSAVPADYPVALLEFTKYRDVNQLNIYLRKELSNRYSYYYSRVEASIYAPLFAAILTVLTAIATSSRLSFNLLSLTGALLVLSTIIISYWLFHYQVQLLKEIDAIETLLVLKEKNRILKLIQLLRSNKLIPQLESKSSKGHDQ